MVSSKELKKILKNLTNGKKYITNFINNQPVDIPFNNDIIQLLLTFHPNKNGKNIDNIEHTIVRHRPPYNHKSLYIKTKDRAEDDISYVLCLKVLYDKYDRTQHTIADITSTFRNTISNTSRQLFFFNKCVLENNEYLGICVICNKKDKPDIDHYPISFQQILDEFLTENNIILENVKFKEIDNCFEFTDYEFQNKWIRHHDKIAKFRVLCKYCNRSNGSNGYKKR
jgi:hypothetical protein